VELMAEDPDYLVRVYVARRLPEGRLFRLAVMAKRFGRLCVAVT
jgi:hypothetical protein